MPMFRVLVSIEIEAETEEGAIRQTMNEICDDTMIIESVAKIADPECRRNGHRDSGRGVCVRCGDAI